ncbi:MAG TPA: hypothetical protein VL651_09935 [Bacteroidia bacterium]|jgi:hypothetical protein|nr:hypothetical protein [Bacteroidia bacterium]
MRFSVLLVILFSFCAFSPAHAQHVTRVDTVALRDSIDEAYKEKEKIRDLEETEHRMLERESGQRKSILMFVILGILGILALLAGLIIFIVRMSRRR